MDDFNENYVSLFTSLFCIHFVLLQKICFNGLIVPRDYLLFFKYIRTPMTHYYSWAIPNDTALAYIQSRGPIVEIGSGSGHPSFFVMFLLFVFVAFHPFYFPFFFFFF